MVCGNKTPSKKKARFVVSVDRIFVWRSYGTELLQLPLPGETKKAFKRERVIRSLHLGSKTTSCVPFWGCFGCVPKRIFSDVQTVFKRTGSSLGMVSPSYRVLSTVKA